MSDLPTPRLGTHPMSFFLGCVVGIPVLLFWIVLFVSVSVLGSIGSEEEQCTIVRIPLHGILMSTGDGLSSLLSGGMMTSAETLSEAIRSASEDENILGLLIDINSPGGTPVAADEVMRALVDSPIPSVAVIHDMGTSAAYWAAVGTDHIIASPISDVGSIGVTMSYLELAGKNADEGSAFVELSSGSFKDAGNPDRVLREIEKEHFQQQVDEVYEYMLESISERRKNIARERLRELADGRAWLGREALTLGLIDELGGMEKAYSYFAHTLSIPEDDIVICDESGDLDWLL